MEKLKVYLETTTNRFFLGETEHENFIQINTDCRLKLNLKTKELTVCLPKDMHIELTNGLNWSLIKVRIDD